MLLVSGRKVVYPSQGPCLIGPVVERNIDDTTLRFYKLVVLNSGRGPNGGGSLFVPVDKILALGIRPLVEKSEIPRLMHHLKRRRRPNGTWRQRNMNNRQLFVSGSAFDLAEVVACLTVLRRRKALSFGESKTLERARHLLVSEISEVLGISSEQAEQQVDVAFQTRNKAGKTLRNSKGGLPGIRRRNKSHKEAVGQRARKIQRVSGYPA